MPPKPPFKKGSQHWNALSMPMILVVRQ